MAAIETAGATDVSFVGTRKAEVQAERSAAGCLLVPPEWPSPTYRTVIRVAEPRTAFARTMSRFYPTAELQPGVHPTAVVGMNVEMGALVFIGPNAVVGDGARIGVATSIGAGCSVGKRVVLGEGCVLHPHVTVYDNVDIGRGTILHSGCVIGADGFGYVMEHDRWHKFPQVGRVEIGDFVEIGANACVDRAALGVTSIGEGTKLDNMVHVGHNCRIGRHVVVAAQTGFLALEDAPLEERAAGPPALDQPGGILEHRLEDAQPAPRGEDAGRDHAPDDRDLGADPRPPGARHRRDLGGVEVAEGDVVQQVPRGRDAEPRQQLGAALADPLEELDGGIEPELRHGAPRRRGAAAVAGPRRSAQSPSSLRA